VEWQWSLWVILELTAVIGLVVMTFYSRNLFPARVRNISLAFFTLGTAYMLLNAIEIGTGAPAIKYIFFKSQFAILPVVATIWLVFILKYIHEDQRLTPRTIALLSILPVFVAILALTNEVHHLLWTGSLPSSNSFLFIYGQTPLLWFSGACIWAIFIYGVFLLSRQIRLMAEPIRGDAFGILFAAIAVTIMGCFETADVERNSPYPMSALGWGFAIAFAFITSSLRFLRGAHIRPMAEQTAIDSLTDAVIAVDTQTNVIYMNTAGEKLTGCTFAEAYKQPLKNLLLSWPKQIMDMVQQPSVPTIKELRMEKNGEYSCCEVGASPMRDSAGNLMGQALLIRDITGRIKAEEDKQEIERKAQMASRLSTVGQMAAGICHEINNPLTAVIGYSDLLTTKDLPEGVKQDLERIRDGGRRVANIVRQLLAFARSDKPAREMVNINDIVSSTLRFREHQLEIANIKVLTNLAPDLPSIFADAGQLQQVFINIILNAETEMTLAHGRGKLVIETKCIDDIIRISFKDDGPGILEEKISRIFDPFFTTRRVGEGTGLGLSVCHGIITEHNGKIYAQSQQGKGTTLIVELPITIETKQTKMPSAARQEIQQVHTRKCDILVIDDETTVLQFVEQLLTDKGHYVDAVDNAKDAIEFFNRKSYDLIPMDVLMPDMTGIELYKKFRQMDKSVGSRVLIMTGDVLGTTNRAVISKTRVPCIDKPFDPDVLMMKIDEVIHQNR
jgi:PAS domain S-box-containing protein